MGEHTVVYDHTNSINDYESTTMTAAGRTMHTRGNMYRLKFSENWYIMGESNGKCGGKVNKGDDANATPVPELKFVAHRVHTLQVNYDRSFVYA